MGGRLNAVQSADKSELHLYHVPPTSPWAADRSSGSKHAYNILASVAAAVVLVLIYPGS